MRHIEPCCYNPEIAESDSPISLLTGSQNNMQSDLQCRKHSMEQTMISKLDLLNQLKTKNNKLELQLRQLSKELCQEELKVKSQLRSSSHSSTLRSTDEMVAYTYNPASYLQPRKPSIHELFPQKTNIEQRLPHKTTNRYKISIGDLYEDSTKPSMQAYLQDDRNEFLQGYGYEYHPFLDNKSELLTRPSSKKSSTSILKCKEMSRPKRTQNRGHAQRSAILSKLKMC